MIGAKCVMAMPLYVSHPRSTEIVDFGAGVAASADDLPFWTQDFVGPVGTPMTAELVS